jgi:hypothetical protein
VKVVQTSISGFTKRMSFSWTIESAISRVQYLRQDLIIPTGKPWSEMSKMWPPLRVNQVARPPYW